MKSGDCGKYISKDMNKMYMLLEEKCTDDFSYHGNGGVL